MKYPGTRRKLATVGLTAAIVTGGVAAGATLGAPIVSGAQDPTTTEPTTETTEAPADDEAAPTPEDFDAARQQHHTDALQPLVDDGTLTQDQLDAVITALEEAGPPMGMHGGRGHGPGLDAAAEALGLTEDELRTALEDGSSLADVAAANGVDVQAMIDAMVADLEAHLAEEVASGDRTQEEADTALAEATERITAMVNGELPAGGPHGPGRFGPPPGAPGAETPSTD